MNKITLVFFILITFSYVEAKPPYKNTAFEFNNIINFKDKTTLQELIYIGEEKRKIVIWEGNKKTIQKKTTHVYHSFFENNIAIEILVYSEKNKNKGNGKDLASQYAKIIGQMPYVLIQRLDALVIFLDPQIDKYLVAIGSPWDRTVTFFPLYNLSETPYLEELFVHELVHASLDKPPSGLYKALNPKISKNSSKIKNLNNGKFRKARKKDKEYISDYAKKAVYEDLAESFLMWLAYRYNRVSEVEKAKILEAIPNRIKYFDAQNFNMYPIISY